MELPTPRRRLFFFSRPPGALSGDRRSGSALSYGEGARWDSPLPSLFALLLSGGIPLRGTAHRVSLSKKEEAPRHCGKAELWSSPFFMCSNSKL